MTVLFVLCSCVTFRVYSDTVDLIRAQAFYILQFKLVYPQKCLHSIFCFVSPTEFRKKRLQLLYLKILTLFSLNFKLHLTFFTFYSHILQFWLLSLNSGFTSCNTVFSPPQNKQHFKWHLNGKIRSEAITNVS